MERVSRYGNGHKRVKPTEYRSTAVMGNDFLVDYFRKQAKGGAGVIHPLAQQYNPAGAYASHGIIVVEQHTKANESTLPLQSVEPSEQVASQAMSDLKHDQNLDGTVSMGGQKRASGKTSTTKQVKSRVRRVQDALTERSSQNKSRSGKTKTS
ncbi:MAG: hypothetical protein V3T76_09800 [candidate division NC10 bacterium]